MLVSASSRGGVRSEKKRFLFNNSVRFYIAHGNLSPDRNDFPQCRLHQKPLG